MFKKLLFSLLALLVIYSGAVIVYRVFEPQLDTNEQRGFTYLEYSGLKEYILSYGESAKHVILFSSTKDASSVYLKDTILSSVQADTTIPVDQIIEIVDLASYSSQDIRALLQRDWDVRSIPALICTGVQNGNIVVMDRLAWTDEEPITAAMIETWLTANGFNIFRD